jgi:CDP-glucose 4,6-dehydratase
MGHRIGDVRDEEALFRAIRAARPDYLFHLAAQPIVRSAHARPAETWSTNVTGTVNVLEALRRLGRPCPSVIVTTDKVYAEASSPHAEDEPLSGDEPYGASKAASELAVRAWRRSFGLRAVATARSGNVIGGGDWAQDRLVPDCVRALSAGRAIPVRNPAFVRPWQHVLDPLHGYLLLGVWLGLRKRADLAGNSGAFNFGPRPGGHRTVRDLVQEVLRRWPGRWRASAQAGTPREAPVLRLDASEARRLLGWTPRWGFAESVARTVAWYQHAHSPQAAREITLQQIADFSRDSE